MGFILRRPNDRSDETGVPRRRFKLWPLLLFAVFGLIYYFSNLQTVPVTGRTQFVDLDRETEAALGLQSYQQVLQSSNIVSSGADVERIRAIGKRIAAVADDPGFEWEFNLLRSDERNAFCLPGGKVAVYTGILSVAQNDDGLAVIMAHEISHAIARHGAERMAQGTLVQLGQLAVGMSVSEMDPQAQRGVMTAFGLGAQFGVLLPFSRSHESEADYIGLMYLARACFDPTEAPKLWERMAEAAEGAPAEWMSTHPSSETRIDQFKEWMPLALDEYKKHCSAPTAKL